MKAVILAGGEGTRLRPLTSNQPKPMMPIANLPMMEHIVKLLAREDSLLYQRLGSLKRRLSVREVGAGLVEISIGLVDLLRTRVFGGMRRRTWRRIPPEREARSAVRRAGFAPAAPPHITTASRTP